MPRFGCSVHAVGAFDSAFKQTILVATPRSRDATRPSCAFNLFALLEGVGNAGCPWHPQPRVRFALVEMHTSKRVPRNHPTFPHAMVLTVSFELSPVTTLVCHRRPRTNVVSKPGRADITSANLTPASGRQDHTTSPYAATSLVRSLLIAHKSFNPPCNPVARKTLPRPPHSTPRFVTIMIRPSCGVGWRQF